MPAAKSLEQHVQDCRNVHGDKYDYSLINNFKSIVHKVKIKCNMCNNIFEQFFRKHKEGQGCPLCNKGNAKSLGLHIQDCITVHGNKYDYSLIDNFKNSHTKVKIKCNACNTIFEQRLADHKNGKGCPVCNRGSNTLDLHIKDCITVHGNRYDYSLIDNFKSVNYKVKIKCNTCNTIFEQKLQNHKSGKGCPICKSSKMENKVAQLAKDHFISREKSFEGLVGLGGHPLRFDFEFKDFLLECQGIQHFKYKKGFHKNEKAFHKQVKHDELKKDYCRINNINLEFINYDDDVEQKLREILAKYNINI